MAQLVFEFQTPKQWLASLGNTITIADVATALNKAKHFTSPKHALNWLMAYHPKLKDSNYLPSQRISMEGGLAMYEWVCNERGWLD